MILAIHHRNKVAAAQRTWLCASPDTQRLDGEQSAVLSRNHMFSNSVFSVIIISRAATTRISLSRSFLSLSLSQFLLVLRSISWLFLHQSSRRQRTRTLSDNVMVYFGVNHHPLRHTKMGTLNFLRPTAELSYKSVTLPIKSQLWCEWKLIKTQISSSATQLWARVLSNLRNRPFHWPAAKWPFCQR